MAGETTEALRQRNKRRLLKAARMYAMCRKAGISESLLPVSLALAAFEEVPLKEATDFLRANKPDLEDLAWSFANSNSPEEFEEKLRQRLSRGGHSRRSGDAG